MGLTQEQVAAYEPVIGLEVHVQLKTASKIFCGCSTLFGDPPNTHVCPVCLGLPGSLPVLNRQALELAVRAALALNCQVRERSRFARKNYFYPDLPKGYQISQFELPLSEHGGLEIPLNGGLKRIGITRVHLEEDAGKSLHEGFPDSDRNTYLDFNRCGVPLIEIVSEPDLRTPAEAYEYLTTLKQILEYIEVSDCDMEKGSLRCDANLSIRRRGAEKLGVKAEVKNLNSFRYLVRALEYEIERQVALLESGGTVEQETRLFNVAAGRTEPMRSKEFAHDYRYFPEPDLLPPMIDSTWREKIRREMPELPAAKRARFAGDYGLTDYDAGVLTATRPLADYFEAVAKASPNPKAAANWIQSELLALLKDSGKEITESPVPSAAVGELLGLVEGGTLSGRMAKTVFAQMYATGKPAKEIIAAEKMEQVSDTGEIEKLCRQALEANPQQVEAYKKGKTALFAFFVGQVMKASRGQANPQLVNDTLKRLLA